MGKISVKLPVFIASVSRATLARHHTVDKLGELTAGEMREIRPQRPVILLPLCSHEDQGPHAPMGDYLSAERVAEHIAARATEAGTPTFVAPVLPFGGADFFASMPGGISLSQSTLCAVLTDMLACLMRHGLDRIVVINGHAGNVQAIHDCTQPLWLENGVLVPSLYLWWVGYGMLASILGPDIARRAAGHGADQLTSVAMHLFPNLIRHDLVPGPQPASVVEGLTVSGFAPPRSRASSWPSPSKWSRSHRMASFWAIPACLLRRPGP